MRVKRIVLIATCFLLLHLPKAFAEPALSPEYLIKAAFIHKFAMFIEWPEAAFPQKDSPIIIGIVGRDPFGSALDHTVQGNRVNKRDFVIKRIPRGQDIADCHIVFISSAETRRVRELVERLRDVPVLLVGETPGFARRGGTVNFRVEDNKVRFEINIDAAKRAGLNVSSKLLRVARIVHEQEWDGEAKDK